MSKVAGELIEQFRQLASSDQRELFSLLLREFAAVPAPGASARRMSIAEVAGRHRPMPNPDTASHDAGFAEAVAASKTNPLAA